MKVKSSWGSAKHIITSMETHNKSILFLCQDYEDFKFLSEGSFGRVYSAMDRYTGDKVAIKVIKIEDSENEESGFPSFLVREIGTLKIASHPNIIEYPSSYSGSKRSV